MRLTKNINGMVWFASQDADLWLEPNEMSYRDNRIAIDKLATYEDAEEQGRLVMLPCKVGETVWRIATCRIDLTGYRMEWGEQRIIEGVPFRLSMLDAFGKTVFLTRAEAEAAFKREQDDG